MSTKPLVTQVLLLGLRSGGGDSVPAKTGLGGAMGSHRGAGPHPLPAVTRSRLEVTDG